MNTPALRSGQISFSGLGSGTDFASMVDKLVQLERRHLLHLEAQRREVVDKKTAFQDLNTKLLNLHTSAQGMDTMSEFLVKTANSANTAVLTATATGTARVGAHVINVGQLAQNHILTSTTSFSSQTTDITGSASRNFVYSYSGGANQTIAVPAGTTLQGLANLINTHPGNPGVRAGIIQVAAGDFRLQLRGMDLGSGRTVVVNPLTTVPGLAPANFTTTQTAQNAHLRVDGFPAAPGWIERSSNTFSDLIEGVSVTLHGAGTTTLNISVNNDAVRGNVRRFVTQVNEVYSRIRELTQVVGGRGSLLTSNSSIRMIDSRLNSILATRGLGFDVNNDVFTSLGMIGITTDANQGSPTFGLLRLDEAILDSSLRDRPNELAQIFAANYIGSSNSPNFGFHSSIPGVTRGGVYTINYTVSGGAVTAATINGRPAGISGGNMITGAHGNPEAGLAVNVANLTAGTYSGNIFLRIGKVRELADALRGLTDTTTGPMNISRNSYINLTQSIDRNIELERRNVSRIEMDLRNRFARLEALLGRYDALGRSIASQLAQLGPARR